METSLHRTLKERYAVGGSGRPEIVIGGFRVDAVDQAGRLIEVQSGALGPLRGKLRLLLPEHRIRIIKPVVLKRRLIRKSTPTGPVLSTRQSPKRGRLFDVFDDLIGLVRVFPHTNLEIDVVGVTIEEVRLSAAAGRATRLPIATWAKPTRRNRLSPPLICGPYCHQDVKAGNHSRHTN